MPICEHGVMLSDADLVAFLPTADLDRARAFFSQVIGLPIVDDTRFACVFESKGTLLRVALVDEVRPVPYTVLGWSVSDAADTVRRFTAQGVAFERFEGMDQDELGVWTTPSGDLVAWFKDPDGNVLSITQANRR
jgi:catechol 2,3-dioxygenase-like lactoylglutathione lyase family enzyme